MRFYNFTFEIFLYFSDKNALQSTKQVLICCAQKEPLVSFLLFSNPFWKLREHSGLGVAAPKSCCWGCLQANSWPQTPSMAEQLLKRTLQPEAAQALDIKGNSRLGGVQLSGLITVFSPQPLKCSCASRNVSPR